MGYKAELINSCTTYFSPAAQPKKIGEVIEIGSMKVANLVIGIKGYTFEAATNSLKMEYITQILGTDYDVSASGNPSLPNDSFEGYFQYAYDNPNINSVRLGEFTWIDKRQVYGRVIDIKSVEWIEEEDVRINVILQPIYPVAQEVAKTKYKEIRKSHLMVF